VPANERPPLAPEDENQSYLALVIWRWLRDESWQLDPLSPLVAFAC
jgi:hypothetical protein